MHAGDPCRRDRSDAGGQFTYRIAADCVPVAGIVGCARHDNPTFANSTAAMAQARDIAEAIRDLLAWAAMMGGWDAPCWANAQAVLDRAGAAQNAEGDDAIHA